MSIVMLMEKIIDFKTEYYGERRPDGVAPKFIIIHGTEVDEAESLALLRGEREREGSAHYMIAEDGRVFYLVDEKYRAWHAGQSFWEGEADINSNSIGIEIVAVSKSAKFDDCNYTPDQLDALAELLTDIKTRYEIEEWHILGHQDIAPIRRQFEPFYRYDPGVFFPWEELARKGHGIWPDKVHESEWDETPVAEDNLSTFFDAMGHFGYDTRDLNDENKDGLVKALRTHFAPKTVLSGLPNRPTMGDWLLIKVLLKEKLF